MKSAQAYTAENRQLMAGIILKGMKWKKTVINQFECLHNYIDLEDKILRKGVALAQKGEKMFFLI